MNIESLDKTTWDVVISGTGLRESLLAASLARAGKKVLHVDKNPYYGDEYAALSLDELQDWVNGINSDPTSRIRAVTLDFRKPREGPGLATARSYTINLSPGILYATSPVLSLLVNSQLHESLEFLKVGSWFVWDETNAENGLMVVPSGREDVFMDKSLDLKTKRSIVRALKSVMGLEGEITAEISGKSLEEYLAGTPNSLPPKIVSALASLTLSPDGPADIPYLEAEKAVRKHLGSMGRFGPGFAAVVGRYGSGSELVQVLCRAAAVTGNAVYVLGNAVIDISRDVQKPTFERNDDSTSTEENKLDGTNIIGSSLKLKEGETVWTHKLVGTISNIPIKSAPSSDIPTSLDTSIHAKSIFIVSSSLNKLFETAEPPSAAGAVVYFPVGSIAGEDGIKNSAPIFIVAHSSETGECPSGQCILYASTKGDGTGSNGLLEVAVQSLLAKSPEDNGFTGDILVVLHLNEARGSSEQTESTTTDTDGIYVLESSHVEIEVSDSIVDETLNLYERITGSRDGFMEKSDDAIQPNIADNGEGDL